jgi:hypothetical protein
MRAAIPYILPFFLFALITYLGHMIWLVPEAIYPLKTVLVGASLVVFWPWYRQEIRWSMDWWAVFGGVAVFFVWILLEGHYPQLGSPVELQPSDFQSGSVFLFFAAFRLFGSAFIVPLMEELFWRSFALRFLMDAHFKKVPLGAFSWFSFLSVSLAFGFEHHRWLPGILAGLVYALLLYRSKNLFAPILSHTVTNFLLGVYVLWSGEWLFW